MKKTEYTPEPGVYTPKQAAAYLNINLNLVGKLLRTGQLKATRVGTAWKIPRKMCDEFIIAKSENGEVIE